MSYIYNSCICEMCKNEINYVWLLADGRFERKPDKDKFVFADHDKAFKKYNVRVRCPNCKSIAIFEYSLDGKYIEKRA